jgi:hypothetical protein
MNTNMPYPRRQFLHQGLGTALAFGLGACRPSTANTSLNRSTAMNLNLNTSTWTPFCFGRLMVLLPAGSSTGLRTTFWTEDLTLREDLTNMQQLQAEVKAKEQEFKNLKHQDFGNRYIQTYGLGGKGVSVWGYEFGSVSSINGKHYKTSHNYFYSEVPFRVWYLKFDIAPDTSPESQNYLNKLARELRPLADGEVPKEPGFVVKGGIVRTQEWRAEGATLGFSLPFFKNPIDPSTSLVSFSLNSLSMGVNGDKLLERLSPIQSTLLALSGVRVIRKGERTINGLAGEEYLYRERSKDGRWTVYSFRWELAAKAENIYQPQTSMFMNVKLPVTVEYPEPPFKSDEEALAFWDAVTSTLRLRPMQGRDGQAMAPDSSPPPSARVGEVCPKAGVWEARLPPNHLSAKTLASSHYRFKEVGSGLPMPEMFAEFMFPKTAAADNAAVTWHWVKPDWKA